MLPEPSKDSLTITDLARRWRNLGDQQIIEETVIEYGKDGSLEFIIIDGHCDREADREDILYPKYANQPYENLSVSPRQFEIIVKSANPLRLSDVFTSVNYNMSRLFISRNRYVTRDSLFISLDLIKEFEQKNDESLLEATKFFTNPPKRKSQLFNMTEVLVDKYIRNEKIYPTWLDIWNLLIIEYVDSYDETAKIIDDELLSRKKGLHDTSTGLSKSDFRNRFSTWIKK